MSKPEKLVTIGRITSVYGVRGWVKIHSFTEPMENILAFSPWWLRGSKGWEKVEIAEGRRHGKGLIARIDGVDDRDVAQEHYCQRDIAVESSQMPALQEGEFYWHQLEGLEVVSDFEGKQYQLGKVVRIMETGANDVLVVRGGSDGIESRERLVPYVPGEFVTSIDLKLGRVTVNWDPEF